MSTPQSTAPIAQAAIFDQSSRLHLYLEINFQNQSVEQQKASLKKLRTYCREAEPEVKSVMAFGNRFWSTIKPEQTIPSLADFPGYGSGDRRAPATQADLLIWLQTNQSDNLIDVRMKLCMVIKELSLEVHLCEGFVYRNSQDLTGFIDGTANPKEDARYEVTQIPAYQPGAGGSFVLTQKWQHRLDVFSQLAVSEQEKVIGRTKIENVEFEGDEMPVNAHVGRTDIKVDGVTQKIFRRSTPYVEGVHAGLYFLAFSADLNRFDNLLRSMYGLSGDSTSDRLLDYSQPLSGSYWFAPNFELLNSCTETSY